jgi:recombination protein RecA
MPDLIHTILAKIEKQCKAIKKGFDVPAFILSENDDRYAGTRMATGSPKIDGLLHGGFPCGKVVEIFGGEASGKTTTCLTMIAGAQRASKNVIVVFIDAEHALDVDYAVRIGIDPARIVIQQPDYGEQALELVKQACLAKLSDPALATSQLIIVVDSVAALVPKCEFEAEQIDGSGGMASQAQMMSQAMRQIIGPISNANACAVFVNQTREMMNSKAHTTPGGRALKFYSALRLKMARIEKWEIGDGNKCQMEVAKSKLFPPFKKTTFHIGPNGIDNWIGLVEEGCELKVITKKGSWLKLGETSIGQGIIKARDYIKANPEAAQEVVNGIAAAHAAGVKPIATAAPAPPPDGDLEADKELMAG